jgi:MATE family multidrug resistance protein
MQTKAKLTSFRPGSFPELLAIALPLIIVSLSENIMIFFDRIILSHYSLNSLNAATLASQAVEIFQYGLWAITGVGELFVASLFAKKALKKMAIPTWQMLHLSLLSIPVIFLLSQFGGTWVLPLDYQQAGLAYYRILMYVVPLAGIIAALSGFFVGQGKIKLIVFSSIAINVLNLGLDYILIFGVGDVIPAMGAAGAAISAVTSLFVQVIWLALIFLNRRHRENFNTLSIKFNLTYFLKGIKVGLPISLSHACEMLALLVITKLIAGTSVKNFTIISIGNTLYLIFAFISDGLYRSISTITSHHFGANNLFAIKKTLHKGFALLFICLVILAIPFMLFPITTIHLFNLKHYGPDWYNAIKINLGFIWLYFLLSGIYWVFAAMITARFHTRFIMFVNIISIWLTTTLVFYLLCKFHLLPTDYIWGIMCLYVLVSSASVFIYYRLVFKPLNIS